MSEKEILDYNFMSEEVSFFFFLLFYTVLKLLVKCKMSAVKLLRLQEIVTSPRLLEMGNAEKLRKFLFDQNDIIRTSQQTRPDYEMFISTLNERNLDCWICCTDISVDLLLIKDLILQESKAYINNQIKKDMSTIVDKLSMQYDVANIEIPYGMRVACSLIN